MTMNLLYLKIKDQIFYKIKDNDEIRKAVGMWNVKWSRYKTIMLYGHISLWDTSNVTDMSSLFSKQ
jgi:hypothetical protein